MELTQSQISEILSNYTSSSTGFGSLQSLMMNYQSTKAAVHEQNPRY